MAVQSEKGVTTPMKQHKKTPAILLSVLLTLGMIVPTLAVSAADTGSDTATRLILGDADLDGVVTVLDANRIQRYLADMAEK